MNSPAFTSTQQNPTLHSPTEALITQLYVGPDFREVAAGLLRPALQALYPTLEIDPNLTLAGTPQWELIDDEIVPGPIKYQTLTDILTNQAILGIPALYIEGEHFLTRYPIADPAIHLPVRMDEIARLLNALAPVMLSAYQEEQVTYWNKASADGSPRWQTLSGTLRNLWNVERVPGWTADDCRMARSLFNTPEFDDRTSGMKGIKACLVDCYLIDNRNEKQPRQTSIAVLIGSEGERTTVLTHSLTNGFRKFTSLEQFSESLSAMVGHYADSRELQWQLWEPDGNFFDRQACRLISLQLEAIAALDFSDLRFVSPIDRSLQSPPAKEAEIQGTVDVGWYENQLPDWLKTASLPDLNNYARHLKDLAALHSLNAGKSFLDDIPLITDYALHALKTEMLKDHAEAATLDLESFELRVQSPVIWGTFIVPGKIERSAFRLADLALQNLIVLPIGDKTLHSTKGTALPAWMTVEYIERLITRIDIGSAYPALIKSKLLDDPLEAQRRQALYTKHLRIQLPLLALQCKIRGQDGIDSLGCRYVAALMEPEAKNRTVDGQTIVIRPLAFLPKRRRDTTTDIVANMFVIGPRDPSAGPCLLYRPMLDQPLTQYPSTTNLLYAIAQSANLRDSVLAWLADDVRDDYANYVFPNALPSPWVVADFLVDANKLETMTGPMTLGKQEVSGDPFSALFKANTDALVKMADRQSVSNAESRWASFKQAGWMIFGTVLPFLGRTAGIAAWIWQIMDQLNTLVEAREKNDTPAKWAALIDVLLNLGMAITLHIATRGPTPKRPANDTSRPEPAPIRQPLTLTKLPDLAGEALPAQDQNLFSIGALSRSASSLSKVLDSFKTDRPPRLGTANSEAGAWQHLYGANHKWYAPVGSRWFEVTVNDNEDVVIIDPKQADRTGPVLVKNLKGEWFIDTRLRLRGGGPKSLIKKAEVLAQQRATELRTQLTAFENGKAAAQRELQQAHQAMTQATPDTTAGKRQLYLQRLESQRADYETALQRLKALQVFSPLPDYQKRALNYLKAQLDLGHAGIREALTAFTPKLRIVLDRVEQQAQDRQQRYIDDARIMTRLNQDMIERLQGIESRFGELKSLEKEGMRLVQSSKKLLPAYTVDDLKALQVTMARNLCLTPASLTTAADAWTTLDKIVDGADIAIQTLRDTLDLLGPARLEERIEILNGLIEQFNVIDDRLQDFHNEFTAHVLSKPVEGLRRQIDEFSKRGASHLVLALEERATARATRGLLAPPPRPKKIFIRTRYNGVLIGEPQLNALGLETSLVDITSPLTNKVIATFHEKAPGIWVERVTRTKAPSTPVDLQTSLRTGQTLLDDLGAFNTRMATQMNQPTRTPAGVEYLYHDQARQLEQASSDIERALTRLNVTESRPPSAATINKQLYDAIETLLRQAKVDRLKLTQQQSPTVSGLEWLKNNQYVSITKTVSRRRLKADKPTWLDEYAIKDKGDQQILWYAHFHYTTSWSPARTFTYARLKTPQEQRMGLAADVATSLPEQQRLAFYRSMVGTEQARRIFFTPD
ncbi:dermonecrotic toxin domain-containing protein [Pseudomonas sp. NPDC089569]|uniref:dermonecrotic toxin domain-containing protein n=1 Tax=Pseudomonas sp. NPDC089569 TaxID=3390722 RepID=UPI003D05F31B